MPVHRIVIDPEDFYRELCLHVGYLFMTWASFENTLSGVLKLHLANVISEDPNETSTIAMSSAIFGSMRFKAARDAINRIIASQPPKPLKAGKLGKIFEHIGNVEKFRDYFAHQSIQPTGQSLDGRWQITTMMTAKDLSKVQFFQFTTDAVEKAWTDVNLAMSALTDRDVTGVSLIDSLIGDDPLPAWHYKPSLLKPVHHSKASPPPGFVPPLQP